MDLSEAHGELSQKTAEYIALVMKVGQLEKRLVFLPDFLSATDKK